MIFPDKRNIRSRKGIHFQCRAKSWLSADSSRSSGGIAMRRRARREIIVAERPALATVFLQKT
jgi:hypothetical protein